MTGLIARLQDSLGPAGCLLPTAGEAARFADSSGDDAARTPAVVMRPATLEQIASALALCHAADQPVVTQGGLTGLSGGANVVADEFALSLARFAGIEALDAETGTMTLRAGTVLAEAQEAARAAGWRLPVDLGARGSCQIGGVIATNAGGNRVIRDGGLRAHVLGLEAVLADGTVVSHLSQAIKDNTGYALHQILIGSEGTLAVITRAVIRLLPIEPEPGTALCALPDFASVLGLLRLARARGGVAAFEVMWRGMFDFCGGRGLLPSADPFVVLLEAAEETLSGVVETAYETGLVTDALVARSLAEARGFWAIREIDSTERPLRHAVNLDISLPAAAMARFATALDAAVAEWDAQVDCHFFGHLGDGNLHVLTSSPQDERHRIEAAAYDLVRDMGGAISAEHGIGRLKRDWLGHSRGVEEIALMRRLKAAFDPKGLLNPGKVI